MHPTQRLRAGEIEALADSLTACADELHARVMKAIRKNPPGGPPPEANGNMEAGIGHGPAQALFGTEVALRQSASTLYLDAALLATSGLTVPQQQLLNVTAEARHQIRRINVLKDLIDLGADVLSLAAALAGGKPEHLPGVADNIKDHLAKLKEDRATPS